MLQTVVFELESIYKVCPERSCGHHTHGGDVSLCQHRGASRTLLLKGQMRHIKDFSGIAFLCSPLYVVYHKKSISFKLYKVYSCI